MRDRRSGLRAQAWDQLDLLPRAQGVGARQGDGHGQPGGGGYLDGCNPAELRTRGSKKIAKIPRTAGTGFDAREDALLAELDAMGLSRVMLQVAQAIGFDNFMRMWGILDGAYEARTDNDSGIYIRLQRLTAYRRYQRNRFIESLAAMGETQPEIARLVKRELGEDVSDRHIWRLMAGARVKT